MSNINPQFQEILESAKARRGDTNTDTMIVASHLAQMRTFILRRGIEFYCEQDSYGKRRDFLKSIYDTNMLEMKLDSIIDHFLCDGQGLFYFRPSGESYQLLYFPKDRYRCYRDQNNEINNVVLIYSFAVKGKGFGGQMSSSQYGQSSQRGGRKKYIRLSVYKDRIEQTISDEKIEFDDNNTGYMAQQKPGQTETLTNSLGFIPAVEIFNHLDCTGETTGRGEFDWLSHQIMFHDELVRNVRKNMKFFGNPTLVSSRPKHDIVESGNDGASRPTISSAAGFKPMSAPGMPFGGPSPLDGQIKVPRVIANLEPTDRVSYMTPDAVSGDQNLYVKQYRSEIRLALGGVDDIDINTASTAYEIKSLYGRVAATAEKKAKSMFEFGLCKTFSMMIQHEEFLFEESFARAAGLEKPVIPLREEFANDEQGYEKALATYNIFQADFLKARDEQFRAKLDAGDIPPGVVGLIPDGNTKVSWRWTGEVFEDDTQDILNNSIVVRNLQELGVDSIEALKYLFPGKTDEERAAMLSGYPFRMVQQTQQSLQSFIGLLGQLYQLPHPQTPNLPLASDPNLDITGFLYRSLEFLRKELSYSGRYQPSSSDNRPSKLSDADRLRSERGQSIRDERRIKLPGVTDDGSSTGSSGSGLPTAGGPGSSGQSMAGSLPGFERKSEYAQPIPSPGSVLGLPDTDPTGQLPSTLGFNSATAASPVFGTPDVQSPSFNPGVFGAGARGPGPIGRPGSSPVPQQPQRPTGSSRRKRK